MNEKQSKLKPIKKNKNELSAVKLKLLVTVVNRNKGELFADYIESKGVNMQMVVYGNGTANTEILHVLGLTNTEKAIILSVIREDKIKETLEMISDKLSNVKNGKGIAFTVPFSGMIGVRLFGFLANNRPEVNEEV